MKILVFASALFVSLCTTGCGEKSSKKEEKSFSVKADWTLPLVAGGDGINEVTLTFARDGGAKPSSVELRAFHPRMPMMNNHGTDEDTQVFHKTDDASVVRVTGIYFNMPGAEGEWVVTLTAAVDDLVGDVKLSLPAVN